MTLSAQHLTVVEDNAVALLNYGLVRICFEYCTGRACGFRLPGILSLAFSALAGAIDLLPARSKDLSLQRGTVQYNTFYMVDKPRSGSAFHETCPFKLHRSSGLSGLKFDWSRKGLRLYSSRRPEFSSDNVLDRQRRRSTPYWAKKSVDHHED